ncbi:MAG: endonuclease/exonuclease/phosphatase family protein [Deltaproteobacteria bacterium]|nr:endonuclease/exonuclease/phosphatase family protein [Deltaproteobacteria bacterium]
MGRTAVVLALLVLASCSGPRRLPVEPDPDACLVRVMTYNVNFGIAGDESAIEAIRSGDADIVLLQETTPEWEEALREKLDAQYPHMSFRHCCGAGGLAVLSREPFEEKSYVDSPSGWFPALIVNVDSDIGQIQVMNVHLHPPVSESGSVVSGYFSTPAVRLEEISSFYEHLDPDLPTLIAGDFNEREGGKASSFLDAKGFTSVLPEYHPKQKTWHWMTSVGEIDSRLDHIMYDESLEPLDAWVLEEGRSDHMPVVAVFKLDAVGLDESTH